MMKARRLALALTAALNTQAVLAQNYNRPDVVRGLCRKDGCDEFTILDKQPVASGPDGELFRTRVQTFHASAQGRSSGGEENGFVYCSAVRPAIISAAPGQPIAAFFLAPDEQAPAYVQRMSTNFFTLYFALCHGLDAGRLASQDRPGVARAFGYHVGLGASRTVTLNRVEDILRP